MPTLRRLAALLPLLFLASLLHAQTAQLTFEHQFQAGSKVPRESVFSPDGSRLAISDADGSIHLWHLGDWKLLRTLIHPGGVTSIAFTPDGATLASGGYDGTVRLWNLAAATAPRVLRGHTAPVWSVAVSSDGRLLASSGEDTTVRLWRVADGAPMHTLRGHARNVWHVQFSQDGAFVVSGSYDRLVKIWRTRDGRLIRTLAGHEQAVVGIDVSRDGIIASSGDDSTIRLWRLSDGRLLRILRRPGQQHVYGVAFTPDGRWLVSGGREKGAMGTFWKQIAGPSSTHDATVALWRVRDGALMQTLAHHADDVWSVAASGDRIATASEDRSVSLWRLTVH